MGVALLAGAGGGGAGIDFGRRAVLEMLGRRGVFPFRSSSGDLSIGYSLSASPGRGGGGPPSPLVVNVCLLSGGVDSGSELFPTLRKVAFFSAATASSLIRLGWVRLL